MKFYTNLFPLESFGKKDRVIEAGSIFTIDSISFDQVKLKPIENSGEGGGENKYTSVSFNCLKFGFKETSFIEKEK